LGQRRKELTNSQNNTNEQQLFVTGEKRMGKSGVTERRVLIFTVGTTRGVSGHFHAPITLMSAETTPWSRVLLETLKVAHMVKILEVPATRHDSVPQTDDPNPISLLFP
jgi:hypothetical protein